MEVAVNAMPALTRPRNSVIRPRHSGPAHQARRRRRDVGLGSAPGASLRLTRRGRVVAAAVAAQATNHALPPGAARQGLVKVVVRPGQSLWSVAESTDPDQDTRVIVQQIVDLNALSGDVVFAGQQLWVPRG